MAKQKHYQISTAIDYPSGRFHLGHAYEKISTDVLARWKSLQDYKVHFSTGNDCHGLKIERNAEKAGKTPSNFVNEISDQFKELCKKLNISHTDFIMTTEKRHKDTVKHILETLYKKGVIYKGDYEGLYCVDCETYYTEKDSEDGNCPVHNKPFEKINEESYFFKLSKYQKDLIKHISKENLIWPKKKEKEILNRLKEPLKDLSISRDKVKWGIPLPFDKDKTTFVWVEALINYLSTINYPKKEHEKFWPAIHIIGSDIVWHHTVIWYSILIALNLKLPKVIVHGFINLKGEKLSKATGLRIDPIELSNKYSTDSLRYFLMRKIPFGQDGDFSEEALKESHNNELANKLGNLISRVSTLAEKYELKKSKPINSQKTIKAVEKHFENYELDKALAEIFAFIDKLNEHIQAKKPWETKDSKVLYQLANGIKDSAILLSPFIPTTSEKIGEIFNFKLTLKDLKQPLKISKIKKAPILFNKIEISAKTENNKTQEKQDLNIMMTDKIPFNDFAKLDLKVGKILEVKDHPKADKLYVLKVDLGEESPRTVVAGLKPYYEKPELKNKKAIFVANLAPVTLRGVESNGMVLAASSKDKSKVIILTTDSDIEQGSKIS